MRKLNNLEVRIIEALLKKNPEQWSEFSRNRNVYECLELDEMGSIKIVGENAPVLAPGKNGPIVTGYHDAGMGTALDKPQIEFILFLKDGKLSELEIFRQDGDRIQVPIDPAQIRVETGYN